MERRGIEVNWVEEAKLEVAMEIVERTEYRSEERKKE
jgi:hypothetical protein